jgi:hypothetical protein
LARAIIRRNWSPLAAARCWPKSQLKCSGAYRPIIDNINLVGSPALPESIRERINQRIEAEQNAATQQQQVAVVEAQARQAVARAEGEARAIALLGQALRSNPEVLRQREIERWRGWCPLDTDTCVIGNQALVTAE